MKRPKRLLDVALLFLALLGFGTGFFFGGSVTPNRRKGRCGRATSEKVILNLSSESEITTLPQLERAFEPLTEADSSTSLRKLRKTASKIVNSKYYSVKGKTSRKANDHAVVKAMYAKARYKRSGIEGGGSGDAALERPPERMKIALSIEGGGMRGCVSAGMVTAISYLGLRESIDCIYGSSAGCLIGAYFSTNQLPWFGPEIYYDMLTFEGTGFIDGKRMLRSLGLGLADPRLIKDVVRRRFGKPVFNLDYLLNKVVKVKKPLDWAKFLEMQETMPLHIVASGLKSEKSVCFSKANGNFDSIDTLIECMWASMLLPGIAGPPVTISKGRNIEQGDGSASGGGAAAAAAGKKSKKSKDGEQFVDALVYEPIPYRSAINDGATHVLVLRTKPDGSNVLVKSSLFERMIMRRFWLRKLGLKRMFRWMSLQFHKKVYAEDVIYLNDKTKETRGSFEIKEGEPHVMAVAIPPGSPDVKRSETNRKEIFEGVKRGFAAAYDALVEDESLVGKGKEVADEVFTNDILETYDPNVAGMGWEKWCSNNQIDAFDSYKGYKQFD